MSSAGRGHRPAVVDLAAGSADRPGEHDVEPAGLAAQDDRLEQLALLGAVGVGGRGRLEAGAGLRGLVVRLGDDGVDPVVEQAVPGLLEQEPADGARRRPPRAGPC